MSEMCLEVSWINRGMTEEDNLTRSKDMPSKVLSELGIDGHNWTESGKTPLMLLLEGQFGQPIEELIAGPDELKDLAKRLGVNFSTISKWRHKLGL
jgi:transcriptional regulator with XRE-family HTH domain